MYIDSNVNDGQVLLIYKKIILLAVDSFSQSMVLKVEALIRAPSAILMKFHE